jgi:hypothetical protein
MILCGVDFSGNGAATEIGNITTDSMASCIDSCATFPSCTGCSWGGAASSNICYMKASLISSHATEQSDWCFARQIT